MDSEFKQFLDILKRLGIKFTINWGPTKESWQKAILEAGYNVTALACTVVEVGDIEFLFCNSKLCWLSGDEGYGPEGLFMMSRDKKTEKVQNRILYEVYDNPNIGTTRPEGFKAAMLKYPSQWGMFEKR